jgi:hypothetical protein
MRQARALNRLVAGYASNLDAFEDVARITREMGAMTQRLKAFADIVPSYASAEHAVVEALVRQERLGTPLALR